MQALRFIAVKQQMQRLQVPNFMESNGKKERVNRWRPTGGDVSECLIKLDTVVHPEVLAAIPFLQKMLTLLLLLIFTITEILKLGIKYLAKKAYNKYKESQREADEKDNDEVRAREN